jgi:hypothetical protein
MLLVFLASHLCDTIGCISEEHLLIETQEINLSRRDSIGVMLRIHESNSGVRCIVQIKPCIHGRKLATNLDEQLNYSCGKLQTTIGKK